VLRKLGEEWHGVTAFIGHGLLTATFWIAVAGILSTVYLYLINPGMPDRVVARLGRIYTAARQQILLRRFNEWFFAGGARKIGNLFSNVGDRMLIEGIVNGSAQPVNRCSGLLRRIQSGFVYHYAFTMIIGLFALLIWWVPR
jgi:NADH-quinone oxidoreductase subunit L